MAPHGYFDCVEPPELWQVPSSDQLKVATSVGGHLERRGSSAGRDGRGGEGLAGATGEEVFILARPATLQLDTEALLETFNRSSSPSPSPFSSSIAMPYGYVEYFPLAAMKQQMEDLGRAEYMDQMLSDDLAHLFESDSHPALSFADFLVPQQRLLWMGTGGTVGAIHFDRQENLMAVVRGAKTFNIFDPAQTDHLYGGAPMREAKFEARDSVPGHGHGHGSDGQGTATSTSPGAYPGGVRQHGRVRLERLYSNVDSTTSPNRMGTYSPVNLSAPDLRRFPAFTQARPRTCRVEEGDVLYLPSRWWHEVESHGDDEGKTIGVNYFFRPFFHKLGFNEALPNFVRNEHYAHLTGEQQSAFACPHDPRRVCFVPSPPPSL